MASRRRRGALARRLNLATVDLPDGHAVLERYERASIDVAVWETTTDVRIPAFRCMIAERRVDPIRRLYAASGAGCHPDRGVALLRALTEAAQSRLTAIAGGRDDMFRSVYSRSRDAASLRRIAASLRPSEGMRDFRDAPSWETDSADEDVVLLLHRLRCVGVDQVVVVDLTKPELGVPVVRVAIPGLEGPSFDGGDPSSYAPGSRAGAVSIRVRIR